MRILLAGLVAGAVLATGQASAASAHNGWTTYAVRDGGITVNRHGVVVESFLHPCKEEDGSAEAVACTWNVGSAPNGNGDGLTYWLNRHDRVHYVWDQGFRPHYPWRWIPSSEQDSFAEGFERHDFSRCIDWHSPLWHHGGIKCPNGWHRSW